MLSPREIALEKADAFADWWKEHQPLIGELFTLKEIEHLCELAFQEGIFMALGDEDRE